MINPSGPRGTHGRPPGTAARASVLAGIAEIRLLQRTSRGCPPSSLLLDRIGAPAHSTSIGESRSRASDATIGSPHPSVQNPMIIRALGYPAEDDLSGGDEYRETWTPGWFGFAGGRPAQLYVPPVRRKAPSRGKNRPDKVRGQVRWGASSHLGFCPQRCKSGGLLDPK